LYSGIVYKISNEVNDKIYVGKTIQEPEYYWNEHKNKCKRGVEKVLYNSMRKYGINKFNFIIIEKLKHFSKKILNDLLLKLEVYYIDELDTQVPNGYNVTSGGLGTADFEREFSEEHLKKLSDWAKQRTGELNPFYGKTHTKEVRETISKKLSGGKIAGENNPFYGKSHTEETKNIISRKNKIICNKEEVKRRNKINQPYRKPIKMFESKGGKLIKEFISLTEASKWIKNNTNYKGDRSHFANIYKENETRAYGYYWKH